MRSSSPHSTTIRINSSRMEANLHKQGFTALKDITDINCLKRHESNMEVVHRPFSGRHVLPAPDHRLGCNGSEAVELKVGFLYEIDHEKMKSPIRVEGIRAVLVSGIAEFNITVRSPSVHSLRTYFSNVNSQNEMGSNIQGYPELDKQFIMPSKLAKEILVRQIPPNEFVKQRHTQSFWLLPSKHTGISPSLIQEDSKNETSVKGVCVSGISPAMINEDLKNETSVKGDLRTSLNCDGLRWGKQKKIKYFGRPKEMTPQVPSLTALVKVEEDALEDVKPKDETKVKCRKRKHEGSKQSKGSKQNKKSKLAKYEEQKPSSKLTEQKTKLSYWWWSQERYKNAEVKMFEIMRVKGAVVGKPILRQALRIEARKQIGDTGLLDHVLKHMADKVAPYGQVRFRRRHNADGAMEYWLENADLVNVRREAGVNDPYWTPPPGWKPGDNPSQDPNFARELQQLKEDMSILKKDVQELHLMKREEEVDKANGILTESSSETCNLEPDTIAISLEEDYENLMKRKAQLEHQLTQIRKRKREDRKRSKKCKESKRLAKEPGKTSEKLKLSYGRWSQDRYKCAEVKMLEIMKAKGAQSGKSMVRQTLRMEARKHIGDTGLLDHILKHMADKVAPNGLDRFRRRHSPDGAMEYWLESADLVNIRREAGVKDPYWIPPLGWNPGDSPWQGPNYAREIKLLKEEMSTIEKDVQGLLLKRVEEGEKVVISTKSSSESCNLESDTGVVSFQEDYDNLVKRKAHLEQQRAQVSESLHGMQGSVSSFLVGPHHPHGSAAIELNNFFRMRPCDFVTSQSLDSEPKESSYILLV